MICLYPCGRVKQPGGCTYATRVAYTPVLAGLAAILPCFEVLQLSVFKNLDNDQHFQCPLFMYAAYMSVIYDLPPGAWHGTYQHISTARPPEPPGSCSCTRGWAVPTVSHAMSEIIYKKKYFVLGHLTVHFLINTIHYRSKLHLQTPHSSIWSNVLLLPDTSFRYALGLLRNLNAGLPACIYSGQPAPIISAILLFFFVHIETISTCSIWSLSFKCHHAHQRLLLIFITFNSHAMCRQSIVDAPFDHDV